MFSKLFYHIFNIINTWPGICNHPNKCPKCGNIRYWTPRFPPETSEPEVLIYLHEKNYLKMAAGWYKTKDKKHGMWNRIHPIPSTAGGRRFCLICHEIY